MADALVRTAPSGLVAAGDEWQAIREQAATLIRSGFLPRAINTPEKAVAVMLAGRELGLPPMQSIRAIAIVDGKPTLSAETMLALAYQRVPGIRVKVESGPEGAVVTGGRPGGPDTVITFGREDAVRAGLMSKDNWRKYPEAMFRARAISAWCRVVAPDAILGCHTPDEVETLRPEAVRIDPAAHEEVADDPRPTQEEGPQEVAAGPVDDEPPPPEDEHPQAPVLISEPQRKRLFAISKTAQKAQNWNEADLTRIMTAVLKKHGFASTKDVTRAAYEAICSEVESWK